MINTDRIVPIEKIDLLSLTGEILTLAGVSYTKLSGGAVEGDFTVTGTGDVGNLLADEPAKSINFASGVTAAVVYFRPGYAFDGFKINGSAVTPTGTVTADGVSLYKATLATAAVTVVKVTP